MQHQCLMRHLYISLLTPSDRLQRVAADHQRVHHGQTMRGNQQPKRLTTEQTYDMQLCSTESP
jgi:hypothetical protein